MQYMFPQYFQISLKLFLNYFFSLKTDTGKNKIKLIPLQNSFLGKEEWLNTFNNSYEDRHEIFTSEKKHLWTLAISLLFKKTLAFLDS